LVWKVLNKTPTGTSVLFGGEDTDKISKLLRGDAAVDTVTIDSDFNIKTSRLKFVSTGSGNPAYTVVSPSGTSARNLTIPNVGQNDTFVMITEPQTLVGKTLTTPIISSISNSGTVTIPTGTDTLVNLTGNQTLTTKTIAYGSNTLTDVASLNTAQTFTTAAKTFNSGLFKIRNPADTFSYIFAGDAITADRTITLPVLTSNDIPVYEAHAQTLTNKTIAATNNTLTGVVTPASTDTLTNKTLTTPTISSILNTGTITLPTATDTLVGRATADTLTNKIINANTNTLQKVQQSPETKWAGGLGLSSVLTTAWGQVTLSGGTGTGTVESDATSGTYRRHATGAASGNQAGVRLGGIMNTSQSPRIRTRFKLSPVEADTTNYRMWWGFTTLATLPTAASDTDQTGRSAFMLCKRTADTNFFIVHNDGSGAATFVDTGVAIDTNKHTVDLFVNGTTNCQWAIDGTSGTISTDLPVSTAQFTPWIYIETATTAAKTVDIYYWWAEWSNIAG
jgi:hypothetical protein